MLALYRLALRLLPPRFRRRFGAALVDEAAVNLREAAGAWSFVVTVLRLGADLVGTIVREWWDVLAQTATRAWRGWTGGAMADLKWAVRSLRRSPGFALSVVAMLAVGIGASTVAAGLSDAYLLELLPYPRSDRLMVLWPSENWSGRMMDLARAGIHSVQGIAGWDGERLVLKAGAEPEELFAAEVTTNLFDVIGVHPALGRGFVASDGKPGATPVVVLSHRTWVQRFGSDPSVLGRSIDLGGGSTARRTVIGVMPSGYVPAEGSHVAAWVPVIVDRTSESYTGEYFMTAFARLAPRATPAQAEREIEGWAPRMAHVDPAWFTPERVRRASAVSLGRWRTSDARTPVLIALAAALLVLLVACANVANLVVARTTARERELSVRAALGAGRLRTARAVATEVAVLGGLGTLLGIALTALTVRVLETRFPGALPAWGLEPDPRWALLAVALSLFAVLAAGLLPALRAARRDPAGAMSGGRGSLGLPRQGRLQEALSAAQLALATAAVAAMAMLARSLLNLDRADPGFEPAHAVTFGVSAPADAFRGDTGVVRFFREARAALASVPGVEAVGFASRLPLSGGDSKFTVEPEGRTFTGDQPRPVAWSRMVTPGYLEALGAHLVAGHIPTPDEEREAETEPVVINRAAARAFWPGESALGKRFYHRRTGAWATVVGVVDDIMEKGPRAPVLPALYMPHLNRAERTMYAAVRAIGEPSALVPQLEKAVHSVSPEAPVFRVTTLSQVWERGLRPEQTLAILATLAGVVTLLLGTLGTYAVVSQGVARRVREIGVRAALGADRGRLLRGEMSRTTRIVALGLAGGLILAGVAGRLLEGALFGVSPVDPMSLAVSLILLGSVGCIAAYVPARRAARVDPLTVLRGE